MTIRTGFKSFYVVFSELSRKIVLTFYLLAIIFSDFVFAEKNYSCAASDCPERKNRRPLSDSFTGKTLRIIFFDGRGIIYDRPKVVVVFFFGFEFGQRIFFAGVKLFEQNIFQSLYVRKSSFAEYLIFRIVAQNAGCSRFVCHTCTDCQYTFIGSKPCRLRNAADHINFAEKNSRNRHHVSQQSYEDIRKIFEGVFNQSHSHVGVPNHYEVDSFVGVTPCQFADALNDIRNIKFNGSSQMADIPIQLLQVFDFEIYVLNRVLLTNSGRHFCQRLVDIFVAVEEFFQYNSGGDKFVAFPFKFKKIQIVLVMSAWYVPVDFVAGEKKMTRSDLSGKKFRPIGKYIPM